MNRGEAAGLGAVAGCATIIFHYAILYFFVFDNLLAVSAQLGHDLSPVESQVWWLLIGFGFILSLRSMSKGYRWARRDFCNHCGKELHKGEF